MARALALAFLGAALPALPLWVDTGTLRLATEIACMLALATLWNLLAGFAGIISIGQQAFVGIGGYALFALVILGGLPALAALPLAGVAAALVAAPAALLLFRLRGAQFAIGSWVLPEVFRLLFAQVTAFGGGSGQSLPVAAVRAIAADRAGRQAVFYLLALSLAAGATAFAWGLLRSRQGLALGATRDSEAAAASLGVDVGAKLLVWIAVAGVTGLAGGLLVLQALRISPDAAFSVQDWTATVIFTVVVGGIGRLEGPLLGTAVYFALRALFAEYGAWYLMGLGALGLAVMLLAPRGLAGALRFELAPITRRI